MKSPLPLTRPVLHALVPHTCGWCSAPLTGAEAVPGPYAVVCCRTCGCGTTVPWPDQAALDEAYAGWYRPPGGRFPPALERLFRRLRTSLALRLHRVAPPGPILDVGAGQGLLVDRLNRLGRSARGLEREPGSVGPTLPASVDAWSGIVFWHSLEHLWDARDALSAAVDSLRPGGVLVLAAPNFRSLQATLFRDRWFALDMPRHVVHLTDRAVAAELERLGMSVERRSSLRGGQVLFGWLAGLVASLPGHRDLYDAIRQADARSGPMTGPDRLAAVAAALVLLPVAGLGVIVESVLRRGGSFYIEARKPAETGRGQAAADA
jgi:SAM-dependent methyltransferase